MTPTITIGESSYAKPVKIDLSTLVSTRLLIQANSGGGKSWAIRRLVEQAFGHIQQIIIDPEGEFATLREKFGFVLVGPGGETPADPRSAALVAEKLLELNASAVCDIYELRAPQRHAWVKAFLDAMINAPKKLWHPCLVIVDESHTFCPEKGMGESEATGAMTDLCTRGRKRGYAAIFATQRLGKLSKNASAELQNRLIGPTFEDIDRKRAAELLGVIKSNEREFFKQIQLLAPGNFFALGRAISFDRVLLKVGPIQTSHPQAGANVTAPPPTPEAIAKLLPKLDDLPKAAEERAATEHELRRQLAEQTKRIRELERAPQAKAVDPEAEQQRLQVAIEKAVENATEAQKRFFHGRVQEFGTALSKTVSELVTAHFSMNGFHPPVVAIPKQITAPTLRIPPQPQRERARNTDRDVRLPIGEKATLTAAAQYPDGVTREQLSILTGYKRSSRDAYIQRLVTKGFVEIAGPGIVATPAGVAALGSDYEPLPEGEALQQYWIARLPEGERKILEILLQHPGQSVPRDTLDEMTGYARSSRDAYIQRLSARKLVQSVGRGEVRASELLF